MKKNNNIRPTGLKGNEVIERMKSLMGASTQINENKTNSVVELTKMGPDGLVYGIVRENHKYFIKIANKKENLIAENFNYTGGLQNVNEGSYPSYSKAAKQLNLKFISLNESLGLNKMINTLKNDNLTEEFVSYSDPIKPSQPDTTLGTVKSMGKNDGHDTEIIGDAGETGGDGVPTPPVVEEDEDVNEDEIVTEEDVDEDIIRGKGHDKELTNTTPPNTGDIEGQTAPIVIDEDEDYFDEEVELNENEKAIDKIINELKDVKLPKKKKVLKENKLRILTALQKIDEGLESKKRVLSEIDNVSREERNEYVRRLKEKYGSNLPTIYIIEKTGWGDEAATERHQLNGNLNIVSNNVNDKSWTLIYTETNSDELLFRAYVGENGLTLTVWKDLGAYKMIHKATAIQLIKLIGDLLGMYGMGLTELNPHISDIFKALTSADRCNEQFIIDATTRNESVLKKKTP